MLDWLQALDTAAFRFVNSALRHPWLDAAMPELSAQPWLFPAVALLAAGLLWKGGARGRLFVFVLLITIALGDMLLINTLKHAVARLRPFDALADVHLLAGRGKSGSMPSSHTSTWFAVAFLAWAYYPRTRWVLYPFAGVMAFSRVYLGVHFPGDVLAGALLGTGYAIAGLWTLHALWRRVGQDWFPLWWERVPKIIPSPGAAPPRVAESSAGLAHLESLHWLRLGYVLLGVVLAARLGYLAAGRIELSEDEAYQWVWSKHPALSYYSKPLLIACTQWLGTHLWGDTAFGVRFFSPVISALVGFCTLRFFAREVNARAAFFLVALVTVTPLAAVGAVLMTIDPLLVLFWSAAMFAGWRAAQTDGTTRHWLWVGWWTGLGFLSKYIAAAQLACWAVFFLLWHPARAHLRKPGPWLALGLSALMTTPVLVWNFQNSWVTVTHVSENAKLDKPWQLTHKFFLDFLGAEFGLLHPILFVAALWAAVAVWRNRRNLSVLTPHASRPAPAPSPNPALLLFLLSMGIPLFAGYWLYTLHSRVQPNWIAAAVLPMLALAVVYWDGRWRAGTRAVRGWLVAALAFGAPAVVLLHHTDWIRKAVPVEIPVKIDPLRHPFRGWFP